MPDASGVHRLARGLSSKLTNDQAFPREALHRVLGPLPELGPDEDSRAMALAMATACIQAFARVLEDDVPGDQIAAPWLTLKYARRLAWEGVGIDEIVRGFRLAQEWTFEQLTAYGRDHASDAAELARFVAWAGERSFRFIDVVCTQVAIEFAAERETLVHGVLAKKAEVVRALLAGERLDVSVAERTLGYRLDVSHLGLLFWRPPRANIEQVSRSLDQAAATIAGLLDCLRPLVLYESPDLLACWIGTPAKQTMPWEAIGAVVESGEFALAAGSPLPGLGGFREPDAARSALAQSHCRRPAPRADSLSRRGAGVASGVRR